MDDNLEQYVALEKKHTEDHGVRVGWKNAEEQYERFAVMLDGMDTLGVRTSKVLDVGCGFGDLIEAWAIDPDKYMGIDRYEPYIEQAREDNPGYRFSVEDVRECTYHADIVVANGTLGWHKSADQRTIMSAMWELTDVCLTYTANENTVPLYAPITMAHALGCKKWTINHNYLPEDYCVHMWK